MAGSKSDYLENKILNHVLGATTYTPDTNLWFGLWTANLTDAATGSTTGEVSGSAYARVQVTNDTTTWGAATTDGTRSNAIAIQFPTATGSWGTITQVAILDASTAGNILYWADLTVSKTITNGDTAKFDIGDIIVTED